MEDLSELKSDMSEVKAELRRISDTMVRNTATLEIHVARTDLAEKRLEHVESFNRWWLGIMCSGIIAIALRLILK